MDDVKWSFWWGELARHYGVGVPSADMIYGGGVEIAGALGGCYNWTNMKTILMAGSVILAVFGVFATVVTVRMAMVGWPVSLWDIIFAVSPIFVALALRIYVVRRYEKGVTRNIILFSGAVALVAALLMFFILGINK